MSYDNIKVNNIMIKEKSILLGTTQINGSLKIVDDKSILLGTDNDISIKYDETTNNALEIAANVEGQALGIILKADQGDDAADTWKLNVADGGTITLGNDIVIKFLDNTDSFEEHEWKELYKLSENTFVEESDSLKESAAGAGLTDND